jgi:hypothetical protein
MEYARIACGNSIPITTRDEHKWEQGEQGTALSADCFQPLRGTSFYATAKNSF